ncbi:MAG: DUF4258 domain-containing protein [Deltaproteobacteria bacterium]|nr:DUF4258 domain-containing protein [Deltaproteobacteria bacterium]
MDFELTKHALDMLKERNISEEWVWQTLDNPDRKNVGVDNNIHYLKSITEYDGRMLHVIVSPHVSPKKVITIFFDRKAGRQK